MTEEEVRFWICRFRELDTTKEEHRQRLIDSFVNAVYVYDDNILLIFNYKDGQETVPLKEANDSVLSGSCVPLVASDMSLATIFCIKKTTRWASGPKEAWWR